MSRSNGNTTAPGPAPGTHDGDDGEKPPSTGDTISKLLVAGLRTLIPLAEGYGRSKREGRIEPGTPTELSEDEKRALQMASAKLVFEGGELFLDNYPSTPAGVPVKRGEIDPETNRYQAPTLAYFVSAARAVMSYRDARAQRQALARMGTSGAEVAAMASQVLAAFDSPQTTTTRMDAGVAAAAPAASRPMAVQQIRRVAMKSNRSQSHTTSRTVAMRSTAASSYSASTRVRTGSSGGCGCGSSKSSVAMVSQRQSTSLQTAAAADDTQAGFFSISKGTQQRLRECLKQALCDFARCYQEVLCAPQPAPSPDPTHPTEEGKELGDCLREAACKLLACLPDALCPPADPPACVDDGCGLPCNFAVEELR
jgi:hypothetical protein